MVHDLVSTCLAWLRWCCFFCLLVWVGGGDGGVLLLPLFVRLFFLCQLFGLYMKSPIPRTESKIEKRYYTLSAFQGLYMLQWVRWSLLFLYVWRNVLQTKHKDFRILFVLWRDDELSGSGSFGWKLSASRFSYGNLGGVVSFCTWKIMLFVLVPPYPAFSWFRSHEPLCGTPPKGVPASEQRLHKDSPATAQSDLSCLHTNSPCAKQHVYSIINS